MISAFHKYHKTPIFGAICVGAERILCLLLILTMLSFSSLSGCSGSSKEDDLKEDNPEEVLSMDDIQELLSISAPSETSKQTDSHDKFSSHREYHYQGRTRVVMLGTGTPAADPQKAGPSVAIVVGAHSYIVDCGAGVVRRAAAAHMMGIKGLEPKRLRRVFLTHLHSDHTVGLPDLWLSPWVLGRRHPLEVYGPPGTSRLTKYLRMAYMEDVQTRRSGPQPANSFGHRIVSTEVSPGVVYKDSRVRVRAFPVRHGRWRYAYGYRFETKDRVVVISGDTVPTEEVVRNCQGCDVLVHDVYSSHGASKLPPSKRAYHRISHTSGYELADLAKRARPKLLVLQHQLLWGANEASLLGEIRSLYSGAVVSAQDLDIY